MKKRRDLPVIPPATLTATQTSIDEPWVPGGVRNFYRWAERLGAQVRLTRAVGPRLGANGEIQEQDSRTLAVALQMPDGRRCVAVWRWMAGTGKWVSDDCQTFPGGRVCTQKEAKGFLDGVA